MKLRILLLLLLGTSILLSADDADKKSNSEFVYIQPVAVEEAPAKKIIEAKPQELVQEEIKKEEVPIEEKQDEDGDGVADRDDKCPNTPEGITVNERGCELDSDNDGVVDSKDKCPDTSKEFVVDGYGCPQTATLKVNFAPSSYAVSEELINDLKEFAQFLQDNTGYQVIVYGYTDNTGNDELNKKLSQNRAESVKEALIRYGISEIRLTAIGKGEENPVADNTTKEGRAANRRIEVELLQ